MNQTSTLTGQCVAEFLGTGLLIFFGAGCVAALRVAGASFGQWEISIIWGLGVAMAIYLTAGVSGAHLNPAVTITLWLFACFERRKVLPFIVAQTAGAFCAAALVYGLYRQLFLDLEQSQHIVRGTAASLNLAGVFSTYPHPHITFIQAFAVETTITAILMAMIMALTDDGNGIPARAAGAVADWLADRRDRRVDGAANRLCAESGARLRPKTVYQSGRVGLDRLYRWAGDPLLSGAAAGAGGGGDYRGVFCIASLSAAICRANAVSMSKRGPPQRSGVSPPDAGGGLFF